MNKPHTKESFLSRTIQSGDCLLWDGAKKSCIRGDQYGWVTYLGKQMAASRLSWYLHYGQIPKGMVVCHKCDVPLCVNPEHLFLGTQAENIADMIAKGRKRMDAPIRKTDGLPVRAKLTAEDCREIQLLRQDGWSQQKIAKTIGVSQKTISNYLSGAINYAK